MQVLISSTERVTRVYKLPLSFFAKHTQVYLSNHQNNHYTKQLFQILNNKNSSVEKLARGPTGPEIVVKLTQEEYFLVMYLNSIVKIGNYRDVKIQNLTLKAKKNQQS